MFSDLFNKFNDLASHHQAFFTFLIALTIICISWAIEKILEDHVFPKKSLRLYATLIIGGILFLWLIKHYILHAI